MRAPPQFTAVRSRSVEIGADSCLGIFGVRETAPFGGNSEEAQGSSAGGCDEHRKSLYVVRFEPTGASVVQRDPIMSPLFSVPTLVL